MYTEPLMIQAIKDEYVVVNADNLHLVDLGDRELTDEELDLISGGWSVTIKIWKVTITYDSNAK